MSVALRKARALFGIYFQEGLAYRASGVIWVMTDVTTAITMPLVLISASKGGQIAGIRVDQTVLYYLCMLLLNSFVTSHVMWDVAVEIKEGQFTTALLRPVDWYLMTFVRNLAWRVFRPLLFLPFFFLFLVLYRGYLEGAHVVLSPAFFLSLVLGHLVSFTFVTMLAMIALYTQEAMSIFELYYLPMLLLSGNLFPIRLFPEWVQRLAHALPFYSTVGAPTEMLVGQTPASAVPGILAAQVFWIVVSYVGYRILWARGLKHYSGVGM